MTRSVASIVLFSLVSGCSLALPEIYIEPQVESLVGTDFLGFAAALEDSVGSGLELSLAADADGLTTDAFTTLRSALTDPGTGVFFDSCKELAPADTTVIILCALVNTELAGALAEDGALADVLQPELAGAMPAGLLGEATLGVTVKSIEVRRSGTQHVEIDVVFGDLSAEACIDTREHSWWGGLLGDREVTLDGDSTEIRLTVTGDLSENDVDYPWPEFCGDSITDSSAWSSEAPHPDDIGYAVTHAEVVVEVSGTVGATKVRGLSTFGNPRAEADFEDALGGVFASATPSTLFDDEIRPSVTLTSIGETRLNRVSELEITGKGKVGYAFDWDVDPDGDGHESGVDNCPFTMNFQQRDDDYDGVGNACEAEVFTAEELARIRSSLYWHCLELDLSYGFGDTRLEPQSEPDDPQQFIDWAWVDHGLEPWNETPVDPNFALERVRQRLEQVSWFSGVPANAVYLEVVQRDDGLFWIGMDMQPLQDLHPDAAVLMMATLPMRPVGY